MTRFTSPDDVVSIQPFPVPDNSNDDYFDLNKFERLVGKLEASKGRQQRQNSLEGRRDTFATGLASMMSYF